MMINYQRIGQSTNHPQPLGKSHLKKLLDVFPKILNILRWLIARSQMESGHKFFTVNLMAVMIVGVNYEGINIATLD